jgi:hypothetical protein
MNTNDDLTILMKQLDEPAPPASLRANVMARIARDADRQRMAAAEKLVQPPRRDLAWLWTFAGLAIVLSATVYGWLAGGSRPNFTSPRIGPGTFALIPQNLPAALIVLAGILIYLPALFAPLRNPQGK